MKLKRNLIGIRGAAGSGKDTVAYLFGAVLSDYLTSNRVYNTGFKWFESDEWKERWTFLKDRALNANGNILKSECTGDFGMIYYETFADNVKYLLSLITGIKYDLFFDSDAKENLFFNFYSFESMWREDLDALYYSGERKNCRLTLLNDESCLYLNYNAKLNTHDLSSEAFKDYWISMRSLMVYFGTHIIQRFFGKKVWINMLKAGMDKNRDDEICRIITDCRFPAEIKYIKESDGLIFKIVSDRKTIKENNSVAERSLDGNYEYDVLINNSGTLDDLLPQFFEILKKYFS